MTSSQTASLLQLLGAGGFGMLIGWYIYYINRYRKSEVQLNDLVTVVGVIGGGAVLALFPARTDLFGGNVVMEPERTLRLKQVIGTVI